MLTAVDKNKSNNLLLEQALQEITIRTKAQTKSGLIIVLRDAR